MMSVWLIMLSGWLWLAFPAAAEVYRYVDDNGVMHYTNDLSTVPEKKRSDAMEQNEYQYTAPLDNGSQPATESDYQRREAEEAFQKEQAARKNNLKKRKDALEKEFQQLLTQKQALDNDEGFQSRRNRRKYKNRPYIKALIEKEQTINTRMVEIEAEMKRLELQP